jgi:hypothetical protein
MSDYTARRIDDMDAAFGGGFKRARAELGVTSFGCQVIDLPPHFARYPDHDHATEGQEEVFVVLRGSGTMDVEGESVVLDADTMVRVGPASRRKIVPGDDGLRVLVIGGVPGAAYAPKPTTEIGGPAPGLGTPAA